MLRRRGEGLARRPEGDSLTLGASELRRRLPRIASSYPSHGPCMSATGQNDTLAVVFDAASVGLQTSGGGSVNRDSARLLARLHAARVPVCVLANTHNSTGSHSHERRHVEVTSSAGTFVSCPLTAPATHYGGFSPNSRLRPGELSVLHIPEDAESAVAAVSTHVQTQFRVQPAFVAGVCSTPLHLPACVCVRSHDTQHVRSCILRLQSSCLQQRSCRQTSLLLPVSEWCSSRRVMCLDVALPRTVLQMCLQRWHGHAVPWLQGLHSQRSEKAAS